jgi:hypothetical protein
MTGIDEDAEWCDWRHAEWLERHPERTAIFQFLNRYHMRLATDLRRSRRCARPDGGKAGRLAVTGLGWWLLRPSVVPHRRRGYLPSP